MKAKDFDITDSIELICKNADNPEFVTKTIHDIYELGYGHGWDDAMSIAEISISKISEL